MYVRVLIIKVPLWTNKLVGVFLRMSRIWINDWYSRLGWNPIVPAWKRPLLKIPIKHRIIIIHQLINLHCHTNTYSMKSFSQLLCSIRERSKIGCRILAFERIGRKGKILHHIGIIRWRTNLALMKTKSLTSSKRLAGEGVTENRWP